MTDSMNIDVYFMVHNEEQMLPYFLRHYGSFARRIFAFEDQSTDNSQKILLSHPAVQIITPDVHGIDEQYWTGTLWAMYEKLSRNADWVMCVDADEFIYHPDLLNFLSAEKKAGTQLLKCRGYTMISDHFPTTTGQIYDEIKVGLPDRMSNKSVVFDPTIRVRFGNGCHSLREAQDGIIYKKNSSLKLLHYRYLGREYFEERDIKNRARFNLAYGEDIPYSPTRKHMQPDGRRGVRLEWYAQHQDEAYNVLEE